jgi:hypothetical protein
MLSRNLRVAGIVIDISLFAFTIPQRLSSNGMQQDKPKRRFNLKLESGEFIHGWFILWRKGEPGKPASLPGSICKEGRLQITRRVPGIFPRGGED